MVYNNRDVGQIEVTCVSGGDHVTIQNYYRYWSNECIPIDMGYIDGNIPASTADISYYTVVPLLGTGVYINF